MCTRWLHISTNNSKISAHIPVSWFCPLSSRMDGCNNVIEGVSMAMTLLWRFLCYCMLLCHHTFSSRVNLTRLHTPTRATPFKPKAGINEILICMNYHDLNDKLNCNFHTFRPVIPFGFLLSLFRMLGASEPSRIKGLTKTRGFSIKKRWIVGKALGQTCIWGEW